MAKHHHPIQGTVKDLASIVGCGRVHLSEVLNHKTLPSVELAKKIEFATGGHIKWTEFFEVHASLQQGHMNGDVMVALLDHEIDAEEREHIREHASEMRRYYQDIEERTAADKAAVSA